MVPKVNLNSESSLVYPESFEGELRSVRLEGEAFFEVVKNPEKRFVVTTPHNASVEVLGTSFNMEAFKWDSIVSTTLISGKVAFISNSGQVNMKPGEKLFIISRRIGRIYIGQAGKLRYPGRME